jgi:hypothetical protein
MENMTAMFLHGVTSMERHGQSLAQTLKLPETGHDLLTKWPGGHFSPYPRFGQKRAKTRKSRKTRFFWFSTIPIKNLATFHFVTRDIMKRCSMFCNRVAWVIENFFQIFFFRKKISCNKNIFVTWKNFSTQCLVWTEDFGDEIRRPTNWKFVAGPPHPPGRRGVAGY